MKKQWKCFLFYFVLMEMFPVFEISGKADAEIIHEEFYRMIVKAGWGFYQAEVCLYVYMKYGILSQTVSYHGAREIPKVKIRHEFYHVVHF